MEEIYFPFQHVICDYTDYEKSYESIELNKSERKLNLSTDTNYVFYAFGIQQFRIIGLPGFPSSDQIADVHFPKIKNFQRVLNEEKKLGRFLNCWLSSVSFDEDWK